MIFFLEMCLAPNKNIAVFYLSLCHLMQWNHSYSFCSYILYIYMSIDIYSSYMNI